MMAENNNDIKSHIEDEVKKQLGEEVKNQIGGVLKEYWEAEMSNNSEAIMENHRVNYRMSFDAMSAYHTSEIEHKKDMITILNGVLVAIVTIFAGVFYFILLKDQQDPDLIKIAFLAVLVIGLLFLYLLHNLMLTNKEKINSDHDQYERFRNECFIEREILNIEKLFPTSDKLLYWKILPTTDKKGNVTRPGSGHSKTINIIQNYSNILMFVIISLTVIALALIYNKFIT